jgi:hypothetical protein
MHSVRYADLDQIAGPAVPNLQKRLPRVVTVPLIICLMALAWVPFIWLIHFLLS